MNKMINCAYLALIVGLTASPALAVGSATETPVGRLHYACTHGSFQLIGELPLSRCTDSEGNERGIIVGGCNRGDKARLPLGKYRNGDKQFARFSALSLDSSSIGLSFLELSVSQNEPTILFADMKLGVVAGSSNLSLSGAESGACNLNFVIGTLTPEDNKSAKTGGSGRKPKVQPVPVTPGVRK